ncbi:chemotaxis protein CheX [Acetobacterium sp.]|uniref:chemotaxis protein CheX n=1 Tax=Acetobacterium sp. TaxID=1872094 RepID=UPI0027180A27|nr:chemotaxis protein CheX [Acetobacterium sp.]MDO9491908.1 chemotaxis protein CheX [Acetobacterium sp.]
MNAGVYIEKYDMISGHVFVAALLESVERMSGFVLNEVENDCEFALVHEIIGAMVLQGEKAMLLTLETNKNSAAPLVSFMTGIETAALDTDLLNDGITELINMVGGSARVRLEATNYKFLLSVPFTLVGESVKIVVKKRTDCFMARLVCDQIDLMLRVYKL